MNELYPLHDKDGYLEFILGMFFHTREARGAATPYELRILLPDWPRGRFGYLLAKIGKHGQVAL